MADSDQRPLSLKLAHLCVLKLAPLRCPVCGRDWRYLRPMSGCNTCAHIRAMTAIAKENEVAPWRPPGLADWTPLVVHSLEGKSLAVVQRSIEEMLTLPADQRNPKPADYDREHPEAYPPPAGVVMVKVD